MEKEETKPGETNTETKATETTTNTVVPESPKVIVDDTDEDAGLEVFDFQKNRTFKGKLLKGHDKGYVFDAPLLPNAKVIIPDLPAISEAMKSDDVQVGSILEFIYKGKRASDGREMFTITLCDPV